MNINKDSLFNKASSCFKKSNLCATAGGNKIDPEECSGSPTPIPGNCSGDALGKLM